MSSVVKFVGAKRPHARPLREEAQVLHLRDAARSAGEAFAFNDEPLRKSSRSSGIIAWLVVGAISLSALFFIY